MSQNIDTSAGRHEASMKAHNRFLANLSNLLQWASIFYTISAHGWIGTLSYVAIMVVFTYFLGVPSFINILRCSQAYSGHRGRMVILLIIQAIWVMALHWLLSLADILDTFTFLVGLGAIRAFSMPRDHLMREQSELNSASNARQSSQ